MSRCPGRPGAARKDSKMLPMPPASAATVSPGPAPSRPHPSPGRQVDFAPLRAARRRRPTGSRACRTTRRAPTASRRLPACRRSAMEIRQPRQASSLYMGRGLDALAFTRRPARRRQLRDDDADAAGAAGRPALSPPRSSATSRCRGRPMRRVIEPLTRMGGTDRGGRRPRAAHGARRTAARHCLRAGDSERPGEERRPARRPASERDDVGHRAGADARSHRARASPRSGFTSRSTGLTVSVDGRPARRAARSRRSRRLLVRGVLDGGGRGAPGIPRRDRGRRPEPDADRPGRRPAALRRPRRGRRDRQRRRRAARNHHRRSAIDARSVEIAPEEVPGADRRAAGHRRPRGPRRRSSGPGRRRSCGSRRATASRRSWPDSARSASTPTSGRTASWCAGRQRRLAAWPTPAATTGWRWRSRSRRSPPNGRRGSRARTRSRFPIRASSRRSPRWSLRPSMKGLKTDKVYLVGFMGAGKTTVARALARRLGWRAIDVDELIEEREHQTVADALRPARRAVLPGRRSEACWSISWASRHCVVATGGGTFVDPQNRAAHQQRRDVGLARRAARRS